MRAILSLLLFTKTIYGSKYCDSRHECADLMEEEAIFCRGYQSCASSTITTSAAAYCVGSEGCHNSESITASSVYCYGDTACAESTTIEATSGSVVCSGISSCIDVENIKSPQNIICAGVNACNGIVGNLEAVDQVQCGGEQSCGNLGGIISAFYVEGTADDAVRQATIEVRDKAYFSGSHSAWGATITSTKGNIQCDGPYACASATMKAHDDVRLFGYGSGYKASIAETPHIYANGYYSAAYSDIHASGSDMIVKFWGLYAGYYADVWCDSVSQCTISCRAKGCLEMAIYYEKDAEVILEPEACAQNQGEVVDGVTCPFLYEYSHKNKAKVKKERDEARSITTKWVSLDDAYDVVGGDFGEPQAQVIMDDKLDDAVIIDEMNDKVSPEKDVIVWFSIFGALLVCVGIAVMVHWFYTNRKTGQHVEKIEKLHASLLYT